ncbi:MAG TPA: SPFH domain-containing protein [Gemmatimonadales bacterium]|nr:SPFH domain-containing protein [Gemmatimonadales bacterium]
MLAYMKAAPTTYVLHYQRGRLRREGPGLAFPYFRPSATIVAIPLASSGAPFVFAEITADFQTVTIQGQLTYRIADPRRLSALLDYSIRPNGSYASDDPEKLPERLIQTLQILARAAVQRRSLRDVLVSSDALLQEVLGAARTAPSVVMLGVEILGLSILAVKPTPEIGRALEAEAREGLQRQSDEAIYARRNAAVEQERRIKENELNTEIAVQEKQRQIRETQMAADIAVEQQRGALIERRSENERKDADARAYALRATLEPVRDVDWRTLMAVGATSADPKLMIALAFRELAENAAKIGEVNVTPDLLRSLLAPPPGTR